MVVDSEMLSIKNNMSNNASQNDSGVLLCPKLTISHKNTQGNQWP